MKLAALIAWSPLRDREHAAATAVRCSATLSFGPRPLAQYVELLGERIQAMVDLANDPHAAAHLFLASMRENGLLNYGPPCPAAEVGTRLVACNSAIYARLMQWDVHQAIERPVMIESLPARVALALDEVDAIDALQMWAWRMGRGARLPKPAVNLVNTPPARPLVDRRSQRQAPWARPR